MLKSHRDRRTVGQGQNLKYQDTLAGPRRAIKGDQGKRGVIVAKGRISKIHIPHQGMGKRSREGVRERLNDKY